MPTKPKATPPPKPICNYYGGPCPICEDMLKPKRKHRRVHAKLDRIACGTGATEPMHILSLGAGVQSSVLALMAMKGELPDSHKLQHAIFADTMAEPQSVYRWLDWLEKQLPFPVHRVVKDKGLIDSITTPKLRKDGKSHWVHSNIPAYVRNPDGSEGIVQRQCTETFKIEPVQKKSRELAGIGRGQKTVGVIQWIGISLDEVHRMRQSRVPWIQFRYPLVDAGMKRHDCLRWMEKNGYPKPPRSSCVFCPYHSNAEWRRLKEEEPEEFQRAVNIEKAYAAAKNVSGLFGKLYLHRSRIPLDQVDFSTDEERGQTVMNWGNECTGMCGV